MVEILVGSLIALVAVMCFGNGLLYFGEDKNSPLMKTLTVFLVITFFVFITSLFVLVIL